MKRLGVTPGEFHYRGWDYGYYPDRPVTGRWAAVRFGVMIGTTTEEGLRRMIDYRVTDEEERKRSGGLYAPGDTHTLSGQRCCVFCGSTEPDRDGACPARDLGPCSMGSK
jgi:hypothetical protein